jgi:1,4-alpha-glucan branching enzyme
MSLGAFCLVLHGHLPWVLHHGRWPHGEDWLFEAAAATWMPLIETLETCRAEGITPCWTLGLTPILLEQLAHDRFKDGFVRYLDERVERATADQEEFTARGDLHLAHLARAHQGRFGQLRDKFIAMGLSIPKTLASFEDLELLSSNATHGFMPLILHDACSRAQLRAGFATSERHLGRRPRGMWLPECAYWPGGPWSPPVVHTDVRQRQGVATLAGDVGCEYFFVDTHLVEKAHPVARLQGDRATPVGSSADGAMCFNSVLEPHRVAEAGAITPVTVMARCPDVSEQVWSGKVGYPGDGRYREFHKVHGMRGLHYWKVTSNKADLGDKEPYYPEDIAETVKAHAQHFVQQIRNRLAGHHHAVGRWGVVCAPFDAELFGHWWHEGPAFLLEVARAMHRSEEVEPMTVGAYLDRVPADKAAELPAGTWGAGGDSRVWFNDELRFYWELAYRAEDRFLNLWHRLPWREDAPGTELLKEAGRQLLLLQASDWPFVIHTEGAVDYGMRRVADHAARLDDLCNGVEDVLSGAPLDPVVAQTLERCRLVDPVFPDLDLSWWC